MTEIEVILLIENSRKAMAAIAEFGYHFRDTMAKAKRPPNDITDANLRLLVAWYIHSAISWVDDTHRFRAAKDREEIKPTQVRYGVIKELNEVAGIFENPKAYLRKRKSLSKYAVRALRKEAPLGAALLSHLESLDPEIETDRRANAVGLGGALDTRNESKDIFGFSDPAPIINDLDTMVRRIKRMNSRAAGVGDTHFLRADKVEWSLSDAEAVALTRAQKGRRGRNVCLDSLRRRLSGEEKANFAFCARQAARLLEITYQMTDPIRNNQAKETETSWLQPYPLAKFIVRIYERFAPSQGGIAYKNIFIPSKPNEAEELASWVLVLAEEGIYCAQEVIASIPKLRAVDLDAGAGLMEISGNARKRIKKDAKRNERALSEEDHLDRLNVARGMIAKALWTLRCDLVLMRGFTVFFGWYKSQLSNHVPPSQNELFGKYYTDIFNPITDWYRELTARYQEGVVFKRDRKLRAGGLPLLVPETPSVASKHFLQKVEYPDGHGFGARYDERVAQALLEAIGEEHLDALTTWASVVEVVPLTLPI